MQCKYLLILFSILFYSCDEQPILLEEKKDPISDPQFFYMKDSESLFFSALFQSEHEGNQLTNTLVHWMGESESMGDTILLNDKGLHGDIIPFDGIYSRIVPNNSDSINTIITPEIKSEVYYQFLGHYGHEIITLYEYSQIENNPPVIQNVSIPDTIVRPTGSGYDHVLVVAEVSDGNGIDDIVNCGFTSLHFGPDTLLNHGNPIWLYDDGGTVEIFPGLFSGDETKGDGQFSIQIPIFGSGNSNPSLQTKTGIFLWTFTAKDKSNEFSSPVEHTVVVE